MTMAIDDDVKVTINFNKLVEKRAKLLTQHGDFAAQVNKGEFLDENDIDRIALELRSSITWNVVNQIADDAIKRYLYLDETKYGDIEPKPGREAHLTDLEKNRKQFKMVKLESPSWTIEVPMRK